MMTEEKTSKFRNIPGKTAIAAIALFAAGGAVGATAARIAGPTIEVAPLSPVAVGKLTEGLVTVRGRVGEVYGNNFVLADGTGKTLVDGGRDGDGRVVSGTPLTVQGWYRDGRLRASFLVAADGSVTQVGGRGGPGGPGRHDRRGGPDGPRGPEGRDGPPMPGDAPAPPPPAAAPAATKAPAAANATT